MLAWIWSAVLVQTNGVDPAPDLHMIRMRVLGEASAFSLLRGEKALLLPCNLEEPPRRFTVRLGYNRILQLS
jgi:hypothetical protein